MNFNSYASLNHGHMMYISGTTGPSRAQTVIDLNHARSKTSFPIPSLSNLIHGNEYIQRKEYLLGLITNDPIFSKKNRSQLARNDKLLLALKISKRLIEIRKTYNLSDSEFISLRLIVNEPIPLYLHEEMFIPVLRAQCSPEQAKYWLPLAEQYRIIGSYAQTELAHGSNLSALETIARFIPETDEFEIHSPDITASKWWIGSLGIISTHTLVQARLVIAKKDYGPHLFVIPIRSLDNHVPFSGVRVGDIGPKLGFNMIDNGWIMFDKYRIPRTNMLMRFAQVTRLGQYMAPAHAKLGYGGMVLLRVTMVQRAAYALAKACTIGVRYAIMRRQFHVKTTTKRKLEHSPHLETPILMYPMVQSRILPRVAECYAILFASKMINEMYQTMSFNSTTSFNVSMLPAIHAHSSALKSYCTTITLDGIEEIRRACGGHGYLVSSGLPNLLMNYTPSVTFEGENYLLTQQTARYLLKILNAIRCQESGLVVHSMTEYLTHVDKSSPIISVNCVSDWYSQTVQKDLFGHRTARLVGELDALAAQETTVFGDLNLECNRVSLAHSQYVLVTSFHHALDKYACQTDADPNICNVLKLVSDLYAISELLKSLSDFTEDGYFSRVQVQYLRTAYQSRLNDITENAVGLVDAWLFSDYELDSCIARKDGRIYEALFEAAMDDPVNQGMFGKAVNSGYAEYIRPLIKGEHRLSKL